MSKANYHKEFERLRSQYFQELKTEYENRIDRAKDKLDAYGKFKNRFINDHFTRTQNALIERHRFLFDISEEDKEDNSRTYEQIFNDHFTKIPQKERLDFLKKLSEYDANRVCANYVNGERGKYVEDEYDSYEPDINSGIFWKGGNETEFVHFIYALYDIGYLTNDRDEKTKLVEQVAKAFNFGLTKNWQSKRSKSIEKSNNDYLPEIIKKLTKAFEKSKELKQAKKKKAGTT